MSTEDDRLKEIRDRFSRDNDAWKPIKEEGATDMKYVAGDPWDPKDRAARKAASRPVLALDELNQYFNQVINDVRANPRAAKFSATGADASAETAIFYSDKMREIEYRSKGQTAYTTAFENAVQRSYGWCRVNAVFESPTSHNQDIVIEPFHNPDMVLPDSEAQRPDSSDMGHCFVHESWVIDDFKKKFPKAKVQSFDDLQQKYPLWVQESTIMLAEYWVVEHTGDILERLRYPDGGTITILESEKEQRAEELAALGTPLPQEKNDLREVEIPQVKQFLTNGIEILDETDWLGKYIPIVSCFGKVIYVDEGSGPTRKIMSMTRLARDPYILYCYYRTAQAELVGMTPKTPYLGYKGVFRSNPNEWAKAAHEPVAYLEAEPYTSDTEHGTPLPLPQRQPYDPPIERLEMGAEGARRAIQAAMGTSPLPTSAQRQNEKSGVALRRIQESQQRGTYHFIDHYDDMIQHVGVIVEDLMDKIYDTARDVGIMGADDEAKVVRINDESIEPSAHQEAPISTKGEHQVTISTGPAFESQREAASDFADQLAANPDIFRLLGPMIIKLKNLGSIGDKMADALKFLQPPELREDEGDGPPVPPEVKQKLAEAEQIIKALQEQLQQMQQAIQTDAVKEQAKTDREMLLAELDTKFKAFLIYL